MPITIAAVIPTYNLEPYIGRAVESALRQTRAFDEILVVDDGSTDDTPNVLERFGERIRILRQANAGASAARNAGIEAAQSRWIAFLDGDDEWLPDYLERMEGIVQRNPKLVWATGNFIRCDCNAGHRQRNDLTPERMEAIRKILAGGEVFDSYFVAHNAFAAGCTDTMMVRRDVLLEAGLFELGMKRINDMDMWFRIAYRHPAIGFIPEPLAIYHLDIPNSIVKAHTDPKIIEDFLRRHFALAEQFGKTAEFRPCAKKLLASWLEILLEQKRGTEARYLLRQFGDLLNLYCRYTTYIRGLFPRLGYVYEHTKKRLSSKTI